MSQWVVGKPLHSGRSFGFFSFFFPGRPLIWPCLPWHVVWRRIKPCQRTSSIAGVVLVGYQWWDTRVGFMSTVGLLCTVLSCALPPIGVSPPGWVNVSRWWGTRICRLPLMGYLGWVHVYGWVTLYGFILCVTTNRGISTWLGQCFPVMGYQDL